MGVPRKAVTVFNPEDRFVWCTGYKPDTCLYFIILTLRTSGGIISAWAGKAAYLTGAFLFLCLFRLIAVRRFFVS